MLHAEWAHLNDPERLRNLAERYLGLAPIAPVQLGSLEALPDRPGVEGDEPKVPHITSLAAAEAPLSAVSGRGLQ